MRRNPTGIHFAKTFMPSIISHAIVGIAAGNALRRRTQRIRFWIFSIICPVLPDADTLAFSLGIPYESFWGHRGFFHSLSLALIVTLVVIGFFPGVAKASWKKWLLLGLYFFLLTASHGILDAFTSGGLGVALLAPFDNSRIFSPYTPIQVSPIRIEAFFSSWGLRVISSEMVWVWLPSLVLMIAVRSAHSWFNRRHR